MKVRSFLAGLFLLSTFFLSGAVVAQGQDQQQPDVMWTTGGSQSPGGQGPRAGQEGRRPGVFGKITAIQGDSIEVTGPDGNKTTLKLTNSTEFRKDRQPATLSDFKVGDAVMVRTDQANGNPTTAVMVAAGGFAMRGQGEGGGRQGQGGGAGMIAMAGTLGKDYVVGEVKTIDAPKLTVIRPDNVTQTLELNEETSLRKGRDSITMADIQAGDHVFARGAVQNNVFVPKDVRVIPPEMWNRMQGMNGPPAPSAPSAPNTPSAPAPPPSLKNLPEPQN